MNPGMIQHGAKKLVEVNGRVQPGESVVVIADTDMKTIADLVVSAARDVGANVVRDLLCGIGIDYPHKSHARRAGQRRPGHLDDCIH